MFSARSGFCVITETQLRRKIKLDNFKYGFRVVDSDVQTI